MTVKELIKQLKNYDKDRIVILSRDGEGNAYYEMNAIDAFLYNNYWEEIGLEKLTPELKEEGYTEEDILKDGVPCIVLC